MPVGLACLLLVLDLAALALLPKKLRRKKSTRIAVICVCSVIAIALAGCSPQFSSTRRTITEHMRKEEP